jgi:hypothetical protein
MFNLPVKEIIVNDDSQVVLREEDGTAYSDNDVAGASTTAGFILEGFISSIIYGSQLELLKAATRIIKDTPAAGTAEIAAYTIAVSTGFKKGDIFRVEVDSLDLTPTEFQNRATEKRYQLSSDQATAANLVAHLVATINGDKASQVTAYAGFNNASPAQNDSAKIVLVAKKVGQSVNLYYSAGTGVGTLTKDAAGVTVYHTVEDTSAVTVAASLPINTYDYLKNIRWDVNFDVDRDLNWLPLPGVQYNSYYFEVNGTVHPSTGNDPIPGEKHNTAKYGVKLWVKSGLTLDTALTLLVGDVNV